MAYFVTCERCGSNLDPGEVCDCVIEEILQTEDVCGICGKVRLREEGIVKKEEVR